MADYLVRWSIDICDAENPWAAALAALQIMLDIDLTDAGGPTCFDITNSETGVETTIDLSHGET